MHPKQNDNASDIYAPYHVTCAYKVNFTHIFGNPNPDLSIHYAVEPLVAFMAIFSNIFLHMRQWHNYNLCPPRQTFATGPSPPLNL